ncbi:Serine/threonine-protein kinase Nek7 [Tetrabaena socialis]|uniref:NEK6-subfamily protein kinase n=1 Tax=Tetrabaena socialis TaxID=47790 RepID=A0A2J8A3C5_9CHLO|nr:Serine/threonine-protein kinase Nek7 [Tetrabaena socialis]|eukprot:PNH07020.1 Serine/threonine-protein kinase Nek7 [Tetrabaena socialis]
MDESLGMSLGISSGRNGLLDSTRPVTNGRGGSVCLGESMDTATASSDISSHAGLNHGTLADYQLERLLGRGKYSQVYLARELHTGLMVAIKRVEIFDMMDPASRAAVVKEVKILTNVEHPNIVKCFRSFLSEADNELVIVLEWAEAGDLGQVIKERQEAGAAFTAEQVWAQFQQVCNALKHMHDRRMMHRDLKPSNIFVTGSGDLKLGDLGLSRYFSSRTLQAGGGSPAHGSSQLLDLRPHLLERIQLSGRGGLNSTRPR